MRITVSNTQVGWVLREKPDKDESLKERSSLFSSHDSRDQGDQDGNMTPPSYLQCGRQREINTHSIPGKYRFPNLEIMMAYSRVKYSGG